VAGLLPHIQLIQSLILLFLVANVLADDPLVPAYRGYEVPSRPKTLARIILLPLSIDSRQVDRAFPLDKSNHLRHSVFRRDRNHHVNMVRQQMTFLDAALFLLGQFAFGAFGN